MKLIALPLWALFISFHTNAQEIDTILFDNDYRDYNSFSLLTKSEASRKYVHYVGVQTNQLAQLIVGYNIENSKLRNPVTLTYSFSNLRSGDGISVGAGLDINRSERPMTSNSDVVVTGTSILIFRVGYEKRFSIGKKMIVGSGFDILFSREENIVQVEKSGLYQTEDITSNGIGPSFRIFGQYKLADKILIGLESFVYFQKISGKTASYFTGLPKEYSSFNMNRTDFVLPVGLFLQFKFY